MVLLFNPVILLSGDYPKEIISNANIYAPAEIIHTLPGKAVTASLFQKKQRKLKRI